MYMEYVLIFIHKLYKNLNEIRPPTLRQIKPAKHLPHHPNLKNKTNLKTSPDKIIIKISNARRYRDFVR